MCTKNWSYCENVEEKKVGGGGPVGVWGGPAGGLLLGEGGLRVYVYEELKLLWKSTGIFWQFWEGALWPFRLGKLGR